MAILEVNNIFPALTSILQSRGRDTGLLVSTPPTIVTTQNRDLSEQDAVLIQAQALLNETIQNLSSTQRTELLLLEALQNLNPTQQSQVLIQTEALLTEALQNVGSSSQSTLLLEVEALLNETLENLNITRQAEILRQTEILINEVLQGLSPTQQSQILLEAEAVLNERLQNLGTLPLEAVSDETAFTAPAAASVTENLGLTQFEANLAGLTTGVATAVPTPPAESPPLDQTVPAVTPTPVTTAAVTVPAEPEVLVPGPTLPVPPVTADPRQYGIAVYEVNSQKLTTLQPEPTPTTVLPAPPIEGGGLIDILLLRPRVERRKETGRPLYIPRNPLSEEEIIRKVINHFNEEQVSKNLPIHLVLAKKEEGLALDIYDCSDNYVCQLVYDTPLAPNELPDLLTNLRHKAGFFVNSTT